MCKKDLLQNSALSPDDSAPPEKDVEITSVYEEESSDDVSAGGNGETPVSDLSLTAGLVCPDKSDTDWQWKYLVCNLESSEKQQSRIEKQLQGEGPVEAARMVGALLLYLPEQNPTAQQTRPVLA